MPDGDLRALGARIVKDFGLKGSFGVYRQGAGQLNVYVYPFLHSTQVKYFVAEQRITVEDPALSVRPVSHRDARTWRLRAGELVG